MPDSLKWSSTDLEQTYINDALAELAQIDANVAALSEQKLKFRQKRASMVIADIIFCFAVFLIFISILTIGIKNDKTRAFFGYSYFTVVSNSMRDEIPKGSLIFVKYTKDLKPGDNITFRMDQTLVTHKIIDIYENNGQTWFQTKGTNNTNPDDYAVNERDVIGKVVRTLPGVGALMISINEKIPLIFIMLGMLIILYFLYYKEGKRKGVNTNEKAY